MTKLLINEPPLQVLPTLAEKIGLNEAIILQQIHYWLQFKRREGREEWREDGVYWVKNSTKEWGKQFPFWSKNTIIRAVKSLEQQGLVKSKERWKDQGDRSKHYTIDYAELENTTPPSTQNGNTHLPKTGKPSTQSGYSRARIMRERATETTAETTGNKTTETDTTPNVVVSDAKNASSEKEHASKDEKAHDHPYVKVGDDKIDRDSYKQVGISRALDDLHDCDSASDASYVVAVVFRDLFNPNGEVREHIARVNKERNRLMGLKTKDGTIDSKVKASERMIQALFHISQFDELQWPSREDAQRDLPDKALNYLSTMITDRIEKDNGQPVDEAAESARQLLGALQ